MGPDIVALRFSSLIYMASESYVFAKAFFPKKRNTHNLFRDGNFIRNLIRKSIRIFPSIPQWFSRFSDSSQFAFQFEWISSFLCSAILRTASHVFKTLFLFMWPESFSSFHDHFPPNFSIADKMPLLEILFIIYAKCEVIDHNLVIPNNSKRGRN